jgi:tetratricopeptide (TPR) repeat protein
MMSRQFESAVEEFNEALTRNPNFALARLFLGAACAYAGMVEDSFRHLELATRLSPRDNFQAVNLSAMGFCHLIAGRFAEAVTYERRAVQLKPRFGTAWRTLAAAAGLAGDTAVAAGALAEAKRMQPSLSPEWVEKYFPVVRPEDRARYIEGLRLAGLE